MKNKKEIFANINKQQKKNINKYSVFYYECLICLTFLQSGAKDNNKINGLFSQLQLTTTDKKFSSEQAKPVEPKMKSSNAQERKFAVSLISFIIFFLSFHNLRISRAINANVQKSLMLYYRCQLTGENVMSIILNKCFSTTRDLKVVKWRIC